MSATWLIRVEGVNFDATITDTNDLSTIRGGSLALLNLDKAVRKVLPDAECEMAGASQALFRLTRDGRRADVEADVRKSIESQFAGGAEVKTAIAGKLDPSTPPFSQLSVVVDVAQLVSEDDYEATVDRLEALNHARQLKQWTVVPLAFAPGTGSHAVLSSTEN